MTDHRRLAPVKTRPLTKLIGVVVTGLLVPLLLAGCVTSKKYRLAKNTTAPSELGWNGASPSGQLTLKTLIVFKGPGSWKREARWDEYIVEITNRSDRAMTFDSASLIDLLGAPQFAGTDPWQIEKLSYTNWEKYGKSGLKLLAGAGAVTLYAGAVSAVATSALASGASAGGAVVLLDVIPVFAIIDVTAVAVMNHQNKNKVQDEFQRRRLVLPVTIPSGASVSGSLFFPMTPGPQRLVLAGHTGDATVELALELKPLAALHLKAAPRGEGALKRAGRSKSGQQPGMASMPAGAQPRGNAWILRPARDDDSS